MTKWTTANIPPQQGRTAIVTGAGGLGYETAMALARAGAEVIIAGRNPQKGAAALASLRRDLPTPNVRFEILDLASLASVSAFTDRIHADLGSLDILINNAGVMMPPQRQETSDGFELQFGTNHLGHFALTAGLMPLLRKSGTARVISLSSVAARNGELDFDNLDARRSYRPMQVYARSKLACLMFAFELQRRSAAAHWAVTSIAAHPGISRTELLHNGPRRFSGPGLTRTLLWFAFQPAAQGALPTLFAATSPDAGPGGYYGPDGFRETRGYPASAQTPPQALDTAAAARLWQISEEMTGASFDNTALAMLRD